LGEVLPYDLRPWLSNPLAEPEIWHLIIIAKEWYPAPHLEVIDPLLLFGLVHDDDPNTRKAGMSQPKNW
jgi:hypothetical protein